MSGCTIQTYTRGEADMPFDPISIGATLLGSVIGGAGSGGSKQEVANEPWEGVKAELRRMYEQGENIYSQGMPYYPGATYAPFNPLQIGGQFGMLDYAQNRYQPGVSTYQRNLFNQQTAPDRVMQNPGVRSMMDSNQRRVTDWLQRDALPGVRSSAAMAGQYGSSRQGIGEGLAIGDAAGRLADANAATTMGAWDSMMRGQTTANAMIPGALQMGFLGPQTAMNIGGMQQGQLQQGINEAQDRYYHPQNQAIDLLNMLTGVYNGSMGFTNQTSTMPGNRLGGALGGATLGAGIANSWNSGGLGALSGPVNTSGYSFGNTAPSGGFNAWDAFNNWG